MSVALNVPTSNKFQEEQESNKKPHILLDYKIFSATAFTKGWSIECERSKVKKITMHEGNAELHVQWCFLCPMHLTFLIYKRQKFIRVQYFD